MSRQPKLPKIPGWEDPKPITHDPQQGQFQVVVSFRVAADIPQDWIETFVRDKLADIHDLDVAVRVIGAGGEASEDEGRYDQLTLTEDSVPRHHTTRAKTDIKPKDGLL